MTGNKNRIKYEKGKFHPYVQVYLLKTEHEFSLFQATEIQQR